MKRLAIWIQSMGLCVAVGAWGEEACHTRAHHGHQHGHEHHVWSTAPVGVMGDHVHPAGGIMVSYRFMAMRMRGMRDGASSLSARDVFDRGFAVSPTEMDMNMHMVGVMWAPSDRVTLMAMIPYVTKEMDHVTASGSMPRMMRGKRFTTRSSDWGDVSLSALVPVYRQGAHHAHLNLGFSLPTGSVKERDPVGPLPFPMQTGSGTFDLNPGATYAGYGELLNWGGHVQGTIRLDDNRNDFAFGNGVQATSWLSYDVTDWVGISGRARYEWLDDIDGDDKRLSMRPSPTMIPDHHGGQWMELGVGLAFNAPRGGLRIAIEALWPVYQDLNGPQMERDYTLVAGWQKAW